MRLGIKLLNVDATINQFQQKDLIQIARGETVNVIFQFVDLDQKGLRYVPAAGATVTVTLPRSDEVIAVATVSASRDRVNKTISRPAAPAFSEDRSIWMLPLSSADTQTLISNSMKVELTEGSKKKIASLTQAIKIISDYEG